MDQAISTGVYSAEAGPCLNQVERIVDTFVAPSRTFIDIRRNTSRWLPFLLVTLFGLGTHATYGQMLAVWMYASLPRLLASVLMMVTLWFGSNVEAFDLKNPVGTNPGFYLPDAAPWLKGVLGFFDVIGIWVLILLVSGTAVVAKVKRGPAAAVVVGWWALMIILTGVITAITS